MIDTVTQRKNMVDTQILPSDITDRRIPRAMLDIPRELFVPDAMKATAYRDAPVPLNLGPLNLGSAPSGSGNRAMLAPQVLAKLIQLLEIEDHSNVLDVGCGTGYGSAILARLSQNVHALEIEGSMVDQARAALTAVNASGVTLHQGPLGAGVPQSAPFDAILIEGGVDLVPSGLLDQLKDKGRLVAIRSEGRSSRACVWQRFGGTFDVQPAFDASAAVLPGFAKARAFTF